MLWRKINNELQFSHYPLVENFTKQKMTSSKWPKTIVINKTNVGLEIMNRKHKFMFAVCHKYDSKSFYYQDTTTGFLMKCCLRNNQRNLHTNDGVLIMRVDLLPDLTVSS